jgi:hypothetical protein
MAIFTTNKIRDFNTATMETELLALTPALPAFSLSFAGFERAPDGRVTPFTEATRVIGRSIIEGVTTVDTAARGDTRIETRDPLTTAQETRINTALDAHDETVDNADQATSRQAAADIVSLRTAVDAGIADPDTALTAKVLLDEVE